MEETGERIEHEAELFRIEFFNGDEVESSFEKHSGYRYCLKQFQTGTMLIGVY